MDLRTLTYLLSVMVSALSNTVASAPASEVAAAASRARHVRNKRCSCATFLDKECVYFCHLDIIWVNTPERVVSYGLGNAPRRRRSAGDSARSPQGPRCRCLSGHDGACDDFCRPDNQLRYNKTLPSEAVLHAEGTLAAAAARINRRKNGESGEGTPVAPRMAAAKARVVLETWRTRRWRRRTEEKEAPVAS